MDRIRIVGGQRLNGSIPISGAKNATLPLMIASLLTEDTLTAYLLGEAERNDVDLLDDVDAVNVVEAHLAYFEAIGAVGPQAGLDDAL